MALKTGTRIELHGMPATGGFAAVAPERAEIRPWRKVNGPIKNGWHIVKFADGGRLCVHESRFRVIDKHNRDRYTSNKL